MTSGDATPFVCGESCHWLCALQKPPWSRPPPRRTFWLVAAPRPPEKGADCQKRAAKSSEEFSSSSEVLTLSQRVDRVRVCVPPPHWTIQRHLCAGFGMAHLSESYLSLKSHFLILYILYICKYIYSSKKTHRVKSFLLRRSRLSPNRECVVV